MISRILQFNVFLVLLTALVLVSCEKENTVSTDNPLEDELLNVRDDDPDRPHRPDCFDLLFPVTLSFPDGSTKEVVSAEELRFEMKNWREENPTATERPSFVYPIQVLTSDGNTLTLETKDDLQDLRDDCDHPNGPNWYRGRRCFNLVYPITIALPNENTVVIENPIELRRAIRRWRMSNPDAEDRPSMVFPIEVNFPNGDSFLVESQEELAQLRDNCDHPTGREWHRFRWCFELVYPVTIEFPNGNTAEAQNARQLQMILRRWRFTHPRADRYPNLVFPVQVSLPNGDVLDVENAMQLRRLREECDRPCNRFDQPERPCFRLVYPLTVVFPDGTSASAESAEELRTLLEDWRINNPDAEGMPTFEFPIQAETSNGNLIDIESAEQLRRLRERCHNPCRPRPNRCFRFVYPLEILFPDGTTVEVDGPEAMKRAIRRWKQANPTANERPDLVFPFDVQLEDGTTATIENEEQFQTLIDTCHP